ncbi:MAG TPA: hypothetical protein PK079_06135 [Leptospiraceae bacterium]|nr:hypothetical protein [Leptospiraceae bacterium]HMW07891.1 hypothetical protein [Leptospiraceae bacterium]HMX33770.1 hypothetical protein [Leptospiraceae bacterium]HMY31154.1 hypothetical protein [Leptospiraceae bacterium]HMZ66663.1 hypothetical protein [Leptospiraceae bacterium]
MKKILLNLLIILLFACNDNSIQVESPSSNQPIRDLIDNNETNSNSNIYRQQNSISGNNGGSSSVGTSSAGAVGTPPATPAVGTSTGGYAGYPTTSGY